MFHFDLPKKKEQLEQLEKQMLDPCFWDDQQQSSEILKKVKTIKNEQSSYVKLQGQYDAFVIFIEHSINLLCKNGFHSFIVPKPTIASENYEPIRKLLLQKSITYLAECASPFEEAGVEAIVFVLKNYNPKKENLHLLRLRELNIIDEELVDQNIFEQIPFHNFSYFINTKNQILFNKVFNDNKKLLEFAELFTRGIETGKTSKN